MLNREEHILECISEECNEIGKAVSKMLRFNHVPGTHQENNKIKLHEEINDLFAVLEMHYGESIFTLVDTLLMKAKKSKVEHYLKYAGV